MSFTPQSNYEKKQKPIPPQGPQVAVCYSIIDLGTHMTSYQGQTPKPTQLLHFSWEFPNLPHAIFDEKKGLQPLAVFQEYSTSMGDKAKLPKLLGSWRGVPAKDLAKELPAFLGQPCLINIEHNRDKQRPDITYANIAMKGLGVMRLPAGTQVGPITNPTIVFNLDNYSHELFMKIPTWLQKKIQTCQEWSGIVAKFGQPPIPVQGQQQQGFGQPQQNFQQQPVQNQQTFGQPQFQQPVQNQQMPGFQTNHTIPAPQQNQGVGFGGEIINTNIFDNDKPPF